MQPERPVDRLRPGRARPAAWLAGLALLAAGLTAHAGPGSGAGTFIANGPGPGAKADPDPAPRDVRAWLMRINQAAGHRNFQGTFVVTAGGLASSARIAHYVEGPNQYERSETLDGEIRQVYRHNHDVVTAWPATRVATVEQRQIAEFPALLKSGDDRIADHYELTPQEGERVAGRDANVLLVAPRDALRYGYRLWSDRRSGLLLRVDTLGEKKEVLESSAFSDVAIDVKPRLESVLLPMTQLEAYHVRRTTLAPARLEDEGWTVHELPGFQPVSCVRRSMASNAGGDAQPAITTNAARTGEVLQSIHSDGLTYVSLFIEPYDARRHRTPMQTAVGATQTLMQRQGDWWVTAVGDVPPATLRLFAQGLERRK